MCVERALSQVHQVPEISLALLTATLAYQLLASPLDGSGLQWFPSLFDIGRSTTDAFVLLLSLERSGIKCHVRDPRTTSKVRVTNAKSPSALQMQTKCSSFCSLGLLHLALCQLLAPVCCIVYIQGTFLPFPVFSRGTVTPLSPLSRWKPPWRSAIPILSGFSAGMLIKSHSPHFSHACYVTCGNMEHSLLTGYGPVLQIHLNGHHGERLEDWNPKLWGRHAQDDFHIT